MSPPTTHRDSPKWELQTGSSLCTHTHLRRKSRCARPERCDDTLPETHHVWGRYRNTPIPLAYTHLLTVFTRVYIMMVPVALAPKLMWSAPPVVMVRRLFLCWVGQEGCSRV